MSEAEVVFVIQKTVCLHVGEISTNFFKFEYQFSCGDEICIQISLSSSIFTSSIFCSDISNFHLQVRIPFLPNKNSMYFILCILRQILCHTGWIYRVNREKKSANLTCPFSLRKSHVPLETTPFPFYLFNPFTEIIPHAILWGLYSNRCTLYGISICLTVYKQWMLVNDLIIVFNSLERFIKTYFFHFIFSIAHTLFGCVLISHIFHYQTWPIIPNKEL